MRKNARFFFNQALGTIQRRLAFEVHFDTFDFFVAQVDDPSPTKVVGAWSWQFITYNTIKYST